jgi:hypothetical protein
MAAPASLPPIEFLEKMLYYDPGTGKFFWLQPTSFRAKAGDEAGTVLTNNRGRQKAHKVVSIGICQRRYLAHRLAWLFGYGKDPGEKLVDHINGDSLDNRLSNLRLATTTENQWNVQQAQSLSRSGLRGAYRHKQSGKWIAEISVNGKKRHLGVFPTAELAAAAYQEAATQRLTLIGAS